MSWFELGILHLAQSRASGRRAYRFFPPKPGMAVACFIHDAAWRSSRSSTDLRSMPLESLPIPTGVTGGTGLSEVPRPNVSLTWPAKPPQQKHEPSPTPYHAIPHFTERFKPGSAFVARASTRSAMPRCGCGRLLSRRKPACPGAQPSRDLPCPSWRRAACKRLLARQCARFRSFESLSLHQTPFSGAVSRRGVAAHLKKA